MKEYKDKSIKDLRDLLNEKQTALQVFRFGAAGSKSKNVFEGKNMKKDIARILTEISMRNKATAK